MKELNEFSVSKRIASFKYAIQGIRIVLKEEHNFRVHLIAAFILVVLGVFFQISPLEWCHCISGIGLVLVTEMINTGIENICDFLSLKKDTRIGSIKDIAAGAVLISSIVAFVIGLIIFLPKLIDFFK